MTEVEQQQYDERIEVAARALAFVGMDGLPVPKLVSQLAAEAAELLDGGTHTDAATDQTLELIFARANELRRRIMHKAVPPSAMKH
jgi:hypothetical protein